VLEQASVGVRKIYDRRKLCLKVLYDAIRNVAVLVGKSRRRKQQSHCEGDQTFFHWSVSLLGFFDWAGIAAAQLRSVAARVGRVELQNG